MAMNWYDRARAINGAYANNSNKEVRLDKLRYDFKKHFMDTTDYQPDALVNNKPQRLIVSKNKNVTTEKKFWTYPGEEARLGDVVDCFNCKWLITEIDPNNDICVTGKMEQCNREISWQNPHTREIISRWVTMSKPYFSNLEEGTQITTSKRMYKMQIPYDEETSLLDNGKRFMLEVIDGEPKTYRITSVDISTQRFQMHGTLQGFISLQIEQDQYNELEDNPELMICNYLPPEEPENDFRLKCKIEYIGDPILKIGGQPKVFTAVFEDINGETVDVEPIWEIETIEEFEQYISVNQNTGKDKAEHTVMLGGTFAIDDDDLSVIENNDGKTLEMTNSGVTHNRGEVIEPFEEHITANQKSNTLSVAVLSTGVLLEGTIVRIKVRDVSNTYYDSVECKVVALI